MPYIPLYSTYTKIHINNYNNCNVQDGVKYKWPLCNIVFITALEEEVKLSNVREADWSDLS